VFRPADGLETALAWGLALERHDGPTALILTRQKLPAIERETRGDLADPRRGAYRIAGAERPDAIAMATGSELHLAVAARKTLAAQGIELGVVSAPCLERFAREEAAYRQALLPPGIPVVSIEAGRSAPWQAWTGRDGLNLGIDRFGGSAPAETVAAQLGMTAEAVTGRIREWLGRPPG
jgi:transketolase